MHVLRLTQTQKGIFYMVVGMLVFSVLNAIVKDTGQNFHPVQIVSFRALFACIPCIIALTMRREWDWSNVIEQRQYHVYRAVLLSLGLVLLFTGIKSLPLSNSMALYFSSSLFLVALSPLILLEKVRLTQWVAVLIGFVGVLIIAQPQPDASLTASLCIIGGALFESLYNLFGRRLSQFTNSLMLTLFGSLFPGLLLLLILPFVWIPPDATGWFALIMLGIGGGLGQLCVTAAYQYAPAGILAPMVYTALLWSILLDIIIYQDFPAIELFIGCGFIVASGAIIILRVRKQKSH